MRPVVSARFQRSRRRCWSAVAASAVAGSTLAALAIPAAHAQSASCAVAYTVSSSWGTGFTAAITVTNTGPGISGWTLQYSYAGNQTLTQGWSGTWSQSGQTVTVTNASWNGSLATGGSAQIGANFSYSGSNTAPASFTLNGTTCGGPAPSPSPSPTPSSPSPPPSPTPSPSGTPSGSPAPTPPSTPGTWTAAPVNPATGGAATFLWLLPDGSVLSNGSSLNQWVKLVPDSHGSYANGTWQTLAASPYGMGAAQEHILPDGRFYQAGGEFIYEFPSGSSANDHNAVQLYNPVTNTWSLGQEGLYGALQDSGSATLANGSIVASDLSAARTQIFSPATNSWTAAGSRPAAAGEDGWVTLPDGSVVSMSTGRQYRYDPSSSTWITLPPAPSGYANGGVDPATTTLMSNGKILVMGSNSSAVYTPGAAPSALGSWAQGPGMPQGSYVDDSYADPEPNGKVLFDTVRCSWLTGACGSASGPQIVEYDPAAGTMTAISEPPDSSGQAVNFINLPNGQVLAAAGNRDWIYTPVGSPLNSSRPTVTSVTANSNGSYHLTGTQLSGFVTTGEDDFQDPQNFPVVYLANAADNIYYPRSYNFSTMAPSTPGETESADFTLPAGLPHGTYNLYVSACGISSATGYSFTY